LNKTNGQIRRTKSQKRHFKWDRGCVERIQWGENEKMEREENKLEKKKRNEKKRGIFF